MISSSARRALQSDAPVTLVCAPPGMGAWNVVVAWAREQGSPVDIIGSDEFEGFGDSDRILLVRLTGDDPPISPKFLTPPVGLRVIAVDEQRRSIPADFAVRIVPGHDLLLSRQEVADQLELVLERKPDVDMVGAFMTATHGWPSLVAIAVGIAAQYGSDGSVDAMEYAVREAVRTSVLPWITGFPSDVIDYLAAAGEIAFAEIDRTFGGVGVTVLTALSALGVLRSRPHRYGSLFSASTPLRSSLTDHMASVGQDRLHTARRRITEARLVLGVGDKGAGAALELRDWKLMIEIVNRWWIDVQFDGDRPDLHRALISIPEPMLRAAPVVAHIAEGAGLLPVGSVPVPIPITEDEILQVATGPGARNFTARSCTAIGARRWRGHLADAHRVALRASAVMDQTIHARITDAHDDGGVAVVDLRTYWYLQSALTCVVADDPVAAERMYRQGWRDQQWDSTGFAAHDLATKFAVLCAVAGDLEQTRLWLAKAEDRPNEVPFVAEFIERSRATAGYVLALDECDVSGLADGAAFTPDRANLDEQWVLILWAQVRHALLVGRPDRALTLLEEAPAHHPLTAGSELLHAKVLRMLHVEVRMASGQGDRALNLARQDIATQTFGNVAAARLALLVGDLAGARSLAAKDAHGPDASVRVRAEANLLLAAAELALGAESEASEAAARATSLITTHGLRSTVLAVASPTLEALAALTDRAEPLVQVRRELACDDVYPETLPVVRLSERESVVLAGLGEGLLVDDLAKALFVSRNTVKTQMRTLYAKLSVNSRDEAIRKARELGFI